MNIQKKQKRISTVIVLATLLLVLISLGALVYAYKQNHWPFDNQKNFSETGDDSINYNPPTKQETESSQDAKRKLGDESKRGDFPDNSVEDSSASSKRDVEVGLTIVEVVSSNLEIRAFVSDVISGTGRCVAYVNKGDRTVSRESAAFIDSSTTQCGNVSIPVEELSEGVWDVWVEFDSPEANGSSEKTKVEIT